MSDGQWTCFEADRPSGWGEAEFRAFVAGHRWRPAVTMPENPHEYTLRREARGDDLFAAAVRYIREHGVMEPYAGRPYKVLPFGEHKYWTMGAPLEVTILINRKLLAADGELRPVE